MAWNSLKVETKKRIRGICENKKKQAGAELCQAQVVQS